MSNSLDEIKNYEITYFSTSASADDVKSALASANAEIIEERSIEKVSLAYPIKKITQAYMGILQFTADPSLLPKINRDLSLKPEMLRQIIIAYSPKKEKAKKEAMEARAVAEAKRKSLRTVVPSTKTAEDTLTNEALEQQIKDISA